ncbi:hypothetical protein [Xanthomonas hortorum]|uniref:hypothetical protein n=1 Tax=Xanthomonas hortorum TaxID=56454 RepID=UPI002936B484|nr:hypothetical protein [Xanthomonas hortorum]MDV2450885.1 hypothetical protein [Xanthomonas hortorum NBC5720]
MIHRVWVLRAQSGHALSKEKATAFGKLEAPVLHAFNRKNASLQPALRKNKAPLQPALSGKKASLKLDAARAAGGHSAGTARLAHDV